jgi:hypothetical protein
MKTRVVLPALLAVGVVYFGMASYAPAFELLDRILYAGGCGCGMEPKCGVVEPRCCAPRHLHVRRCCEPKCGAEVSCGVEKSCGCRERCHRERCHWLHNWLNRCGCEPACGAEPKCGVAPSCGCEKACRPARCHRLFDGLRCKATCGCEPACGVEMMSGT